MMLDVCDLRCGYGKTEVIHGASLTVERGEFVCVIGANGCGKTTLLKALLGVLKPTGGSITIDGKDVTTMHEKEVARHLAYIPQAHIPPFPFTVADMVLLGRTPYINRLSVVSDRDRMVAYRALRLLSIEHLGSRIYTQLSGGQEQLVLIARALAQEPDILIMDEPTASLDFGNQQMVLSRMSALAAMGMSLLMVTHSPDHALLCADRVLVMDEGEIVGDGPPEEVITSESLCRIYKSNARVLDVEVAPGQRASVCVPLI
ncbi:MAG: ABC transporter ATP-binding protein [Coriobacteriia bacterium]|nr:ABC transporter ATP-binding protein [Coriobacteriia bacterium]